MSTTTTTDRTTTEAGAPPTTADAAGRANAQAWQGAAPVSVLIAVRNEVKNLGRCLDALRGWANEVVVVDSQSTDGTVELAEAACATVVQFHYLGGWPKKRQWALDTHNWRNDWILLLDADEILTPGMRAEIERAIQDPQYDGYWLCFRAFFLNRVLLHGDTDLWKLFLFRRGRGRYEMRLQQQNESMADMEIHEHIVVNGRTTRLKNYIHHENLNTLARYIDKHNEYSTWEAHVLTHGTTGELKPSLFGNQAQRRRWLKRLLVRLPGSALLRFLYIYIFRLGFLDGRPGLIFASFKLVQMLHIKAKIYELRVRPPAEGPPN